MTDMIRWTCSETAGTSAHGTATSDWGSTAIGPILDQAGHWFAWANGFVPRVKKEGGPCERDEWPPRAFWRGKEVAEQKGIEQRIRLIPGAHNGGAGSMWNQLCVKNAAAALKKKPTDLDLQNPKFIKTINQNSLSTPCFRVPKNQSRKTPRFLKKQSTPLVRGLLICWGGTRNRGHHPGH
ncbi:hypothetical protein B0T16DRAFT_491217 [Cercophora newfieldiana]|uniref:Uncharacterized protein n=1 Tax=Cercophora newfieldiana TaxID=92897 RepID=A0AA39YBA4_9PEZI|nr:hypothetical protein B0T16DRAFT_491217 [Cercophora newfieldiana]